MFTLVACTNEKQETGRNDNEISTLDKWDREWEIDDGPMGDGEVIVVWFVDSLIEGDIESKENWWFNKNRSLTKELATSLTSEKLAEIRDEIFAAVGEFEQYGDITLITPFEEIDKGLTYSVITKHVRGNIIFNLYIDSDNKFNDFNYEFEISK